MKLSKVVRKKIAERIVWSMNMREGETLRVSGGIHTQELIEEIALNAWKNGVQTMITTSSDDYIKRFYDIVPIRFLRKTSKLGMKIVEVLDNSISIESPRDPRILERVDTNKIAAIKEGNKPINDLMDRLRVKWCYVGYPTEEMASKLNVRVSLLSRFILDAMLVDYKKLMESAKIILDRMRDAKKLRIRDEYGTDLTVELGDRKILVDDGFISNEDKKCYDIGLNLPAGEVFTAPIETRGYGVLYSPLRSDVFTGKIIKGVKLVFENGRLNLRKTKAEVNEKVMKKTIRHCISVDRKTQKTIRTVNIAELGIGLNPIINKVIGYLLTDEKVFGTVHIAIGKNKNKAYGGRSNSCLHWDFVTNKGVDVEVIGKNGRSQILLDKGRVCKDPS